MTKSKLTLKNFRKPRPRLLYTGDMRYENIIHENTLRTARQKQDGRERTPLVHLTFAMQFLTEIRDTRLE